MVNFNRHKYLDALLLKKHNHLIKVITGMRRSEKSYLLFTLFYNHLKSEGVDDQHIIRINLEDRRLKKLRDPDNLLAHIDSKITDEKNALHFA